MRILSYCPIQGADLPRRLGSPEYSYWFVMRGFRPALERIGEVIDVSDPSTQADPLFDSARHAGIPCVLLCFCPPNLAPTGLRCPTSTVVAWEFDTIPSDAWNGNSRNDWRNVLREHGQAITLSTHTRDTIRKALGGSCRVTSIPVPVFDRFSAAADGPRRCVSSSASLSFAGRVVDTRTCESPSAECLMPDHLVDCESLWDRRPTQLSYSGESRDTRGMIGFYDPEPWGTWSRTEVPFLILPFALHGHVRLAITAQGYGKNRGRSITVAVGPEQRTITLTEAPATHSLTVALKSPVNVIRLGPLDISPLTGAQDTRSLGIGLRTVEIRPAKSIRAPFWWFPARARRRLPPSAPARVQLSGVVYSSVLNPLDGRKNLADIITAFAYALGQRDDATLLLKMTHSSFAASLSEALSTLEAIGPMRARVVVLHGFLNSESYRDLIRATTWYVNASHGEGMCLPLMEFMSCGVPAIAPDHTSMADYVTSASSLVVRSSRIPTRWPNDPLHRLRTCYHRIHWKSLVERYRSAHRIATEMPDTYAAMSRHAIEGQRHYSGTTRIESLLRSHLEVHA